MLDIDTQPKMIFACRADNDLYRVLVHLEASCPRYESAAEAVEKAPVGSGVLLLLADNYPQPGPALGEPLLAASAAKRLRLYVEYPAALPGTAFGAPRPTHWERAVVASGFFMPHLQPAAILAQHGCWFLPLEAGSLSLAGLPGSAPPEHPWQPGIGDERIDHPGVTPEQALPEHEEPRFAGLPEGAQVLLALARVAGYDRAVFGLPEDAFPLLFQVPGCDVLVATSALSQFVRGRYGPRAAWKALWERLLRWLEPAGGPWDLAWTPTVRVQAGPLTPLDDQAEAQALSRSLRWFRDQVVYSIDWKKGAIEGFESAIDHEGRQMRRTWTRGDCTAETGMVFACDRAWTRNPASRRLSTQILDYVWSAPDFSQDDANSPAYGLNNWYERGPVFYGDDNARVILSTLLAARLLNDARWDASVLRCLLANLRTTGVLGFRRNRIDLHHLLDEGRGWQFYYREETTSYAPHYQAYLWASYLLAYALTGYEGFVERTRTALRMTMDVYPRWQWTNGMTQELARMLLPLAFLVRIEDTVEHRRWLDRVAGDLCAQMQPCGAIRERLGPIENGRYPPPRSNEAYGTAEAPLIQQDGDPACDLLYTTNYAFLGLHEAAAAIDSVPLMEAGDRLADFLCRIQVRSEAHPYLDGAWMRGFDDTRWEYWGSSADVGWGAWSVESGWTNTWIAAVLAMRRLGTSLFQLATARPLQVSLSSLLQQMLVP